MPIYTFKCTKCENEHDTFLSIKATPDEYPRCPSCGETTKRCISGIPSHSLKGSGWSQDGYACTNLESDAAGERADRQGKVVSFPGQKNKGRE